MEIAALVLLSLFSVQCAVSDTLLPPDPFSVDHLSIDPSKNRPLTSQSYGDLGFKPAIGDQRELKSVEEREKVVENNKKLDMKKLAEPTYVDVPEHIMKEAKSEFKEENQNLRGDSEESEVKRDAVLESIEGAEKQLTDALGTVKSKLLTIGKDHKPIKVDCGTTRVRVVCNKKGEPEEVAEIPEETIETVENEEITPEISELEEEELLE